MDKESCMENMRKQFENMTAEEFAQTWNKYDADGNGFIEGTELTCFFRDLALHKRGSSSAEALSQTMLDEMITQYMEAYDEDMDGKIGMAELADILKPEENFMLIIKTQDARRSRDEFEKIWSKYDNDGNGYIDSAELKSFLRDVFPPEQKVQESALEKYSAALLKMLDSNDDKKLERKEMEKFLSIKD